MRTRFFSIVLALLSLPAGATIATVQHTCNAACATSTTCAVTVSSTGAGHTIVAIALVDATPNNVSLSSVSGAGTYTHCSNCHVFDTSVGGSDASYTLNSTAGVTSITLTLSGTPSSAWRACVREYSGTSLVLNTGATPSGSRDQTTAVTSSADVTLTLSANNGVNIQFGTSGGTMSALAGFANCDFPNGNGVCDKINTTSGASANWTQTSGRNGLGAIAFEESGGAPAKNCTLALMGAGPC